MKVYKQNGQWMSEVMSFGRTEIKAHESFDRAMSYSVGKSSEEDAIFTYPKNLEKEFKSLLDFGIVHGTENYNKLTDKEKSILQMVHRFVDS